MNKLQTIINKVKSFFTSPKEVNPDFPAPTPKEPAEIGQRINGQLFVTLDDSKKVLSTSNPKPTPEMQQTVNEAMRESMMVSEYDSLSQDMLKTGVSVKDKNEILGTRQDASKLPVEDESKFAEKSAEKHESIMRITNSRDKKERREKIESIASKMKEQINSNKQSRAKTLKNGKTTAKNGRTSKTSGKPSTKRRKSK
jgi:flagellar biosynthesis component FlhA